MRYCMQDLRLVGRVFGGTLPGQCVCNFKTVESDMMSMTVEARYQKAYDVAERARLW
jgi:hypothetical protein